MMISSENPRKVTKEDKFSCAVYRKVVDPISILYQFARCWAH